MTARPDAAGPRLTPDTSVCLTTLIPLSWKQRLRQIAADQGTDVAHVVRTALDALLTQGDAKAW